MAQKPTIPKGMRDFAPNDVSKRNYIFETIKSVFKLYGYQPIETPTMENLSTLMGKYGEEGDKLLFKVLNSGDFTKSVGSVEFCNENLGKLASEMCEKGLRYDLTVPFARYVVMHQNEITFPFKRYQIQPVWRADRPQRGRYREFYQCDVDVVGSDSLYFESELIAIARDVFKKLGVRVSFKLNNRKILYGIAEAIGFADKIVDITVAIDKLDKIGIDAVNDELRSKGLSEEAIVTLKPILEIRGDNRCKINQLSNVINGSKVGMKGVEEIETILNYLDSESEQIVELDLSLARGLSYYTGAIFEVKANDFPMGSISGGGRYDDLTGVFGLKGVSGVGISFGADRIYDVLEGLKLFPEKAIDATDVLFANFGQAEFGVALGLLSQLRANEITSEIYPTADKLKKQFDYAQSKGVKFIVFVGQEEIENSVATIKNIIDGSQKKVKFNDLTQFFHTNL